MEALEPRVTAPGNPEAAIPSVRNGPASPGQERIGTPACSTRGAQGIGDEPDYAETVLVGQWSVKGTELVGHERT